MKREFTVVVERDAEGYFLASVPAIPGCHTQARSRDVLDERIREAIAVCLDQEDAAAPRESLELVAVERVSVEA